MSSIFTTRWLLAAVERSLKTIAQTAVALIGTGAVGILDVDWAQIASVSALAGVVSLLTSVASTGVGPTGPSLADETTAPLLVQSATQSDIALRDDPEMRA